MSLVGKLPLLYVLFGASLWRSGPRGAVAQVIGSSSTLKGFCKHDHRGFRFKELTKKSIAKEKGEYFVSLLFAKYGNNNKTVGKTELVYILRNLGFIGDGQEPHNGRVHEVHKQKLGGYQESTSNGHFGEVHKHEIEEARRIVHADKLHPHHVNGSTDDNGNLHVNSSRHAYSQTHTNKHHHHHHSTNAHGCTATSSGKGELSKFHSKVHFENLHQREKNVTSIISSQMETDKIPGHERNLKFNVSQRVIPEIRNKPERRNKRERLGKEDKYTTPGEVGNTRRKRKHGRRVKNGRKEKTRKRNRAQQELRAERDVLVWPFHRHNSNDECLSLTELLQVFQLENKDKITLAEFLYMSPAIIYQLDSKNCSHVTHNALGSHGNRHSHSGITAKSISNIPLKVWGYSFVAVLVISLVGLLGVAIIPVMQKVFYDHLLQFLVALAVGALTGDALLHLLPHALASAESRHDLSSVWKGLCGLLGVYLFFIVERVLGLVAQRRQRAKYGVTADPHSMEEVGMIGSSDQPLKLSTETSTKVTVKENVAPKGQGHGHSHADGKIPKSIAAIAWMVILGDGIHNLSDGLAIGAAFADSVSGGVSTTLAVFCHELPHEIGDFAMLLRTGMPVKQAIVYNVVSSILCFIGMAIGVALGNISDVSLWIFACVGGLFIYIALVDMLPEMTHKEHGGNTFSHLVLQCCGMFTGSGIMLVIAVFEDDLLMALN